MSVSVLADVGWTDWSAFSRQESKVGGVTTKLDRDWDDTFRAGLGVEVELDEAWLLQAGVGYDSSAVDDDKLLPDIPFQDSMRYSLGVQYDWSDTWTFGASYTYMDRGNPEADMVRLSPTVVLDGEFEEMIRHFIAFTFTWRR